MNFPASLRLPAAVLGLLLASCSPQTDDSVIATTKGGAAEKSFVGTIRLLEHNYTLGVRETDYVTLTFNGPRLRREVRRGSFADSANRHGIIVDLRTDSVTYYVQDAGTKRNGYHRLDTTAYLALVAAQKEVFATADRRPYSILFAPLPPNLPAVSSEKLTSASLSRLTSLRGLLFLLPDAARCDVVYSERVRVPRSALAYIEHNPPAALPTLALAVRYTRPPRNTSDGLLDRLKQEFDYASSQETEFDSLTPIVAADAFDLPSGSTDDLEARWSGPTSSGHHHHHHHH